MPEVFDFGSGGLFRSTTHLGYSGWDRAMVWLTGMEVFNRIVGSGQVGRQLKYEMKYH